jgi:ABC-type uncharacterized transport system ATPase subunit
MTTGQFDPNDFVFENEEQQNRREEILEIMCIAVEEANRRLASQQGQEQLEQIEMWIQQQRPNLRMMNNEIYNALKANGVFSA